MLDLRKDNPNLNSYIKEHYELVYQESVGILYKSSYRLGSEIGPCIYVIFTNSDLYFYVHLNENNQKYFHTNNVEVLKIIEKGLDLA